MVSPLAEETHRMERPPFQGDQDFGGRPLKGFPFNGQDAPSFRGLDPQGAEECGGDPRIRRAGIHEKLERLSALGLLRGGEQDLDGECSHPRGILPEGRRTRGTSPGYRAGSAGESARGGRP